jgi:hypothetical protein
MSASRVALIALLLAGCPGTRGGQGGPGGPGASVGGPAATPRELADQVVALLVARAPDVEKLGVVAADLQRHCKLSPEETQEASAGYPADRAESWKRCSEVADWTAAKVVIASGGAVEHAGEACPGFEVLDAIEVEVQTPRDKIMMTLEAVRVGGDVYKIASKLECVVMAPE